MNKLLFALSLFVWMGCNDSNVNTSSDLLVRNFLKDTRSLERVDFKNPIEEFQKTAEHVADKKMAINAASMNEFMELGKTYSSGVIIVGNHTIVKIDDFSNCKNSGSWGACVPFGEGYIKKGDLEFKKEYINSIIGTPGDQKRMGYLFK